MSKIIDVDESRLIQAAIHELFRGGQNSLSKKVKLNFCFSELIKIWLNADQKSLSTSRFFALN